MARSRDDRLLLGEWACLGVLYRRSVHGFAVAAALGPTGDIGRVWSLSRPLTYRALDQLAERGLVERVGAERGIAGGTRTILATTAAGRNELRRWVRTPVEHMRDLRSELLLKLVIADHCSIDIRPMLERQRKRIAGFAQAMSESRELDVVAIWRQESTEAGLRFVDRVRASLA